MTIKTTNQLNRATWLIDQHIRGDKERLSRWQSIAKWRWQKANDLITDECPIDIAVNELSGELEARYSEEIGFRDFELVLALFDAALADIDWCWLAEKVLDEVRDCPSTNKTDG